MTNELEKQFFQCFGIEPIEIPSREYDSDGEICSYYVEYPQISDRILLELFEILRKYYNLDFWTIDNSFVMDVRDKSASYTNILYRTGGDLKNSTLRSLQLIVNKKLNYNEKIKHQVRTLFEEG